MFEYKVWRIPINNNTKAEQDLNALGKEGFRVVAWSSVNLDLLLVLEREVIKTSGKRQVTVEPPKE